MVAAAPFLAELHLDAATFFDPVQQAEVAVPDDVAPLFRPLKMGSLHLAHRIVMAPLTRCRAIDRTPTPAMALHYGQRASRGGLIIAEATIVVETGAGFANTPGMYSDEQVAAWRTVTDAVHAKGGVFLCQLWHCGRQSHTDYQPGGILPVSSSALAPSKEWTVWSSSSNAMVPYPVPRALELHEIKELVQVYADSAKRAMAAGFDGVEIHGANGYLLDQFLKSGSNLRTDAYGGSIENRARIYLEVVQAVIDAVGDAGRVGIRLSPFQEYGDSHDTTPYATHVYLSEKLKAFKLAYVHMTEARSQIPFPEKEEDINLESLQPFRMAFGGKFIACGNYKRDDAVAAVRSGHCDLVAFGRPFLSSPDLPARLLANVAPNQWDRNTFYVADQVTGYTDYPFMAV